MYTELSFLQPDVLVEMTLLGPRARTGMALSLSVRLPRRVLHGFWALEVKLGDVVLGACPCGCWLADALVCPRNCITELPANLGPGAASLKL